MWTGDSSQPPLVNQLRKRVSQRPQRRDELLLQFCAFDKGIIRVDSQDECFKNRLVVFSRNARKCSGGNLESGGIEIIVDVLAHLGLIGLVA